MENSLINEPSGSKRSRLTFILVILVLAIMGYNIYSSVAIRKNNLVLEQKNKELQEAIKNSTDSLVRVQQEKDNLTNALTSAAEKNKSFSNQLDQVTNTVETLERLRRTDPEILQKYSKVYFLNENYIPSAITSIDTKYLSVKEKPLEIHDRVWPFLKNMLDASAENGTPLKVISAFRSFGTQASIKSAYRTNYGAGSANSFIADQGYSEHQLGTTVDLTTPSLSANFSNFEKDPVYTWLTNNAYRYGFILSYPKNNAFYVFEPWHWRFVGLDLAKKLHDNNLRFYDLEQRDISTYLVNVFNSTTTTSTN